MPRTLDAPLLARWVRAATEALERHRAELDRINVFPVPDGDTGTNLLLTLRAGGEALRRVLREPGAGAQAAAAALARGALGGARGNSGVILSQVLRGVADEIGSAVAAGRDAAGGRVLADALGRAHRLAQEAVSRPREGTVLSVLAAAAVGAAATAGEQLDRVAAAAATAARDAVAATTGQLPELTRAGVVDAGGLGLWVVLDALAALSGGRPPAELPPGPDDGPAWPARGRDVLVAERERGSLAYDYEVMYLVDDLTEDAAAGLREALDEVGDSVAVVGDGAGLWQVHVHCTDIGAAVEAGLAVGRPRRITVVRFADTGSGPEPGGRFVRPRAVLLVAAGADVVDLARAAGADVLVREPGDPVDETALSDALADTGARHVVLLPDDPELTAVADRARGAARRAGQEVVVVPSTSVLQGLAALAVHDPARPAGDDVVAMADAAAGTRTAGLLVAETEALTWRGRCEPGDVLGVTDDGEVVVIAPDLTVGALWLAHRMLTAGGEIVTALLAQDAAAELGEHLAADLRRTHPEVDVVVHRGGPSTFPLRLGVE